MTRALYFSLVFILIVNSPASAQEFESIEDLANFYAPAVFHEIGNNPKADIPTKIDFDGDWIASNNWLNLEYSIPSPYVYYDVISTKTHHFITYAFFHPRDYTNFWFCLPRICHENDLEGVILSIRKGKGLEYIEALAHLSISGKNVPYKYMGNSQHSKHPVERAVIEIESGGHGIYLWKGEESKNHKFYLPMDDDSFPSDKEVTRYQLLPLEKIWDLRKSQPGLFYKTFDFVGERFAIPGLPRSLAGKKFGSGLANWPWSWSELGSKKGEWFLDPALWVYRKLDKPLNFSLEYTRHIYLEQNSSLASN